jgi:hypothetical protein
MCLGKHDSRHTTMMRVGMFFLVAGALSLRYLAACPRVTPDLADGVTGLLYGLAIGCLLVSLRARGRPPAAGG